MLIEIIGWSGSVLVIAAYALNIAGKLASSSNWYFFLNIAGSGALILHTYYHHAFPSAVVNIIWVAIALAALIRSRLGDAAGTPENGGKEKK